MEKCSENNPAMTKPGSSLVEGGKCNIVMGNRRVLRDIKNIVGAPPPYPRAINKRRMPDKFGIDDNISQFVGSRPMTRKFAASLANKQSSQQVLSQKNGTTEKRAISSIPCPHNSEDFTAIEVDEYMETSEFPQPEYVKLTEAMLEEMEAMQDCKEIEMEDLVVEPVLDIDGCDSNNPLAAVDYVEDIYNYYREAEISSCVCPNYMHNQSDVNEKMRAILIDWLVEVHYKFELMDETLFLTVNLIDRFLGQKMVVRKKLQLVGITAMLLACKYEEVCVPVVEDLILISDKAYTREEVLAMETLMINTLQFKMSVPTPYVFMRRFLKAAQSNKQLEFLSFFMIELCLVEYQMLNFRPSLLATAAIYAAQCSLKGFRYWSKTNEWYTKYSESQLQECSRLMVEFHKKAGVGKLTGVHRKYSTFKFGYAAKIEPALFLLARF